jgi:hypothetical protein
MLVMLRPESVSISINQYQSVSISINQYQSVLISINQYPSVSCPTPRAAIASLAMNSRTLLRITARPSARRL